RRRHTRSDRDWSSDVCSSDLACASTHAYLENVSQDANGKIDYFDTSYTPNGRAVIRMSDIQGAYDAREIKKADFLLILNRNENKIGRASCRERVKREGGGEMY